MATVLTSKRGTSSAAMTISSLAVWKTSSTADRPKSKTPSKARTSTRMATTIANMAFLPLAHERFEPYALTVPFHQPQEAAMLTLSLFVRLEAKPGKEEALAAFLMQGLQLANQESTTPLWFALRIGPTTFAIFDAFRDEAGRQAHLDGPIAKALMAQAPDLLATPPEIQHVEVLGAKLPK